MFLLLLTDFAFKLSYRGVGEVIASLLFWVHIMYLLIWTRPHQASLQMFYRMAYVIFQR